MKKQFEEGTDFDASLKKLNSDLIWKTKQKQELKNRIITDIEKLEFQEKNKNSILSTRVKKVSLIRKLAYSSIALIILFGLFIGSAFVSPVMAEVVLKIPFINSIIHEKSIGTIINEELRESNYSLSGTSISYPDKTITISVEGSNQYYKSVKGEIEDIVKGILQSKNYDAYKVKIERYKEYVDLPYNEEDKKQLKKDRELSTALSTALDKVYEKYNLLQLSADSSNKTVEIEVSDTETSVEEIKNEVNKIVQSITNEQFSVKIKKIDMKKVEQDERWRRM